MVPFCCDHTIYVTKVQCAMHFLHSLMNVNGSWTIIVFVPYLYCGLVVLQHGLYGRWKDVKLYKFGAIGILFIMPTNILMAIFWCVENASHHQTYLNMPKIIND